MHGRTVAEMYRSEVHYDYIARAVEAVPCPVLANGNVSSADQAREVMEKTGAAGLMIGRGAIRNPWLFQQIRQAYNGEKPFIPTGFEMLEYIRDLYDSVCSPDVSESCQVQKMKKYTNFIGAGLEPENPFLHDIRRVTNRAEFFAVCERAFAHEQPLALVPKPGEPVAVGS